MSFPRVVSMIGLKLISGLKLILGLKALRLLRCRVEGSWAHRLLGLKGFQSSKRCWLVGCCCCWGLVAVGLW
eukprot:2438803-Amphidinium_carterae.1